MALRPVGADRLGPALSHAQPADELRAEQQSDEQRRRARRTGAAAYVADVIEDPGKSELFADQVEHAWPPRPAATVSTSLARATEFARLHSTASPGCSVRNKRSVAASTLEARS